MSWISSKVSKLLPNGSGKTGKSGKTGLGDGKSGKKEEKRPLAPRECYTVSY